MEIKKTFNKIFVTVGTTKFDDLTKVICTKEIIDTLKALGCQQLVVQYGNGNDFDDRNSGFDGIQVTKYRLKPNILDDIRSSDLIISHAGAGSCIEVLREHKPLIVVVNENLMGNHQIELAKKLSEEEYLFFCSPRTLNDTLRNSNFSSLKEYQKGNMKEFIKSLNILMGL